MAIKFMQREVDTILTNLADSTTWRKLLNVKPHLAIFDVDVLAKQIFAAQQRTPSYDKAVKEEEAKGISKGMVKKFKDSYAGTKYKNVFDQNSKSVERQIQDYCKAILNEYKKLTFIPKAPRAGSIILKNFEYELLESTSKKIRFVIRRAPDKEQGAPFNRFRQINSDIQANFLMSGAGEKYKTLFGIGKREGFDQTRKKITNFQQIGHTDDDAVINKKASSSIVGLSEVDQDVPEDIDLSLAPESLGRLRSTAEAIREKFKITVSLDHLQKYKIEEGQLKDNFTVKVSVESRTENETKSKEEAAVAGKLKRLVKELVKDLAKDYNDAAGNVEKQRSPSPMDIVRKSVLSGPLLKKILKKKVTKKVPPFALKKLPPNPGLKTVLGELEKIGPKGTTSFGVIDAVAKTAMPKYKRNRDSSIEGGAVGQDTQDALTARAFINSNLQKQVERNMGRPALENVTGRFSESVNIVNAGYTGGQAHFDYTYNPIYRVFESGRDYSPNFDPRPLIEKSIRQLAASRLDTKFTLRRV